MKRKVVEGITVKRVRPERCIYEQCSDILLNWRDIRSKFGYKTLYEHMDEIIEAFGTNQCAKSSRQHEYMKTYNEWKISLIAIIKQKRIYITKYVG
jgi:hypothetical protein